VPDSFNKLKPPGATRRLLVSHLLFLDSRLRFAVYSLQCAVLVLFSCSLFPLAAEGALSGVAFIFAVGPLRLYLKYYAGMMAM